MINYVFLLLFLPLYLLFDWLAMGFKSFKIYFIGCLVSTIYFLATSEAVVYVYNKKIPLIGFLINPFQGEYKPFLLNYQYNKVYFWLIGGLIVIGAIFLKLKTIKPKNIDNNKITQ